MTSTMLEKASKAMHVSGSLSRWLDGGVVRNERGEVFVREISLREALGAHDGEGFVDEALETLGILAAEAQAREPGMWLDIETTGWPGRPVFMVGMLCADRNDIAVRQIFARDYSQESALIHEAKRLVMESGLVLTFNGACFDLPFLRDRAAYHRLAWPAVSGHVDLLPLARRRWRGTLPDCRLKTLEAHVSGRPRVGDISSSEIPMRYHDYVHTRDAAIIAPVFRHNLLDMVALAQVSAALAKGERG